MWRHRDEIPDQSAENVENFITSLRCGLDICPKEKIIKSVDRNPFVHGLTGTLHGLRRSPVKKFNFHKLVDYGCRPYLK